MDTEANSSASCIPEHLRRGFVSMIRNKNSVEYEIAKRQLFMKDTPRESIESMSPPDRVGRHIVFPRASVCPSQVVSAL